MKIRIGIIFGGSSREREISFAGGRTVYDNLNKSLFEPVPLFIDSFRNFVLLDWHYIYKGSIRDFYPPVNFIPPSPNEFQVYAESVASENSPVATEMLATLGKKISPGELSSVIDFAFLCLHGPFGEDGRIQGLLETFGIPYSGSGIFASAFGMNKALQKKLMTDSAFEGPAYLTVKCDELVNRNIFENILARVKTEIKLPCVVKPANQGSSIGVSILTDDDPEKLKRAILRAFFMEEISAGFWNSLSHDGKIKYLSSLADIREGIGMPVIISSDALNERKLVVHPEELLVIMNERFTERTEPLLLSGVDSESEIIIESFIDCKEFY
jgi:D-alanine-D-alanine ligase